MAGSSDHGVSVVYGRENVEHALRAAEPLLVDTATPFCAQGPWLATWLAAAPARPLAVVAGAPDAPTGLACLGIRWAGPLRTVILAGDGPSDYGRLPVRDASAAEALARGVAGVLRGLRGPWRLRLAQLPVADPVALRLRDLLPGARLEPGQGCPYMAFGDDRSPQRCLSARVRRAARRGRGWFDRAGVAVELTHTDDPDSIRAALPDLVVLHRTRDHTLRRRSDLDRHWRRAFYLEIVSRLADAGRLDLWTLRLDGGLGAYVLGVRDGTAYRIMDARISDRWLAASPGQVLRADLVTAVLADPHVTELDWLRGELRHKMHDATHVVPAENLLAESSPAVSAACARLATLRHAVKTLIRGNRRAQPGVRAAQQGPAA